jgi:hypothetical protein
MGQFITGNKTRDLAIQYKEARNGGGWSNVDATLMV